MCRWGTAAILSTPREVREFNGRPFVMETGITGDIALGASSPCMHSDVCVLFGVCFVHVSVCLHGTLARAACMCAVKAKKADTFGNLVFSGTACNFNPECAAAGKFTIAEVGSTRCMCTVHALGTRSACNRLCLLHHPYTPVIVP